METLDEIVEDYRNESKIDYVGLWQISSRLERTGITSYTEVKVKALYIAKQLMGYDIMPGHLANKGGFNFWPGTKDELVQRILKEWPIGENPHLGNCDIWFGLNLAMQH